jgi:hypothetical protein
MGKNQISSDDYKQRKNRKESNTTKTTKWQVLPHIF